MTEADIRALQEEIESASAFVQDLEQEMGRTITGQRRMISRLIAGLLCNGHILLEGVPGLAKTLAIRTLAQAVDAVSLRLARHFPRLPDTHGHNELPDAPVLR